MAESSSSSGKSKKPPNRISAGTLVLHEQKADASMREVVGEAIDRTVAEISRRRDDLTRVAFLLAVLGVARWLQVRLGGIVVDRRLEVRKAAAARLRAELAAASIALTIPASEARVAAAADQAYAEAAAATLASAWQAQAVAMGARADEPARAIEKTRLLMRPRIARTAATEMASAYNEEHRASLERAIEKDSALKRALDEGRIIRVWDAYLDRRTCDACEARHDREVDFGDEPPLHPNCRCIVTIQHVSAAKAA